MENARRRPHAVRNTGIAVLLALFLGGGTAGAQGSVSGRVTATDGTPLAGVEVSVQGTNTRVRTDEGGRYAISAPSDGILIFAMIGYRGVSVGVGGRTAVDVTMQPAIAVLQEVVVTGYTTERRADITGAVATVMPRRLRYSSKSAFCAITSRVASRASTAATLSASGMLRMAPARTRLTLFLMNASSFARCRAISI